jgi:hypothetical protein
VKTLAIPFFVEKKMTSTFYSGDGYGFFDPSDGAIGEAIPGDPVIQGMQMAMLQECAPPELMFEASSKFQRSW